MLGEIHDCDVMLPERRGDRIAVDPAAHPARAALPPLRRALAGRVRARHLAPARARAVGAGHAKFTPRSPSLHKFPLLLANSVRTEQIRERETPMTSRVDMHCHSTASQLLPAGGSALARTARVRDAAGGGLRAGQAARDGLRHDHRPRHDRRLPRAGRPSRLLRLRGADRPLRRRAPGGSRPLLRDHSRRPRVAAGTCRRCRGLRRIPARERDRLRARAPVLQRRRAADPAPPPPPRRALPGLGGPQRLARRGAEHARRRSTSRPTAAPASAAPTTTPAWTSAAPSPRCPLPPRRKSFCATCARRRRGRRRAGQRRQVGARGDGAGDPRPGSPTGEDRGRRRCRGARPGRGAEDRRSG